MNEKKVEGPGLVSWEEFKDWFQGIFKVEPRITAWESFLHGVRKGESIKAQQISQLQARNSELVSEKRGVEVQLRSRIKSLEKEIEGLQRKETPQGVETPLSISQWATQEFGQGSILNYGLRALQEMVELTVELQKGDQAKAQEELSDVDICLDRLSFKLGHDRRTGVDQKMKVNRSRSWISNGDGTGQHLKTEAQDTSNLQAQMMKTGEIKGLEPQFLMPDFLRDQHPTPETWLIEYSGNGIWWGTLQEKGTHEEMKFSSFGEAFDFIPQAQKWLDPSWFKFRIKGVGLAPGGHDIIVDGDLSSVFPMSD